MPVVQSDFGTYLIGFTIALVAALVLTYVVREIGRRAELFDHIDDRKVHDRPVPRIGGVAIFLAVAVSLAFLALRSTLPESGLMQGGLPIVLAGALLIHVVGLVDDLYPIRARWKFLLQIAIAAAVYFAGVQVTRLTLPWAGSVELNQALGLLFTVGWLVGITNAFNLIDGLDGLASGAALFALLAMFVVASIYGQVGAATVTIVLAGATLGFLFYNFHPASIFLGDSGSLFLGFMLAGIGLLSSQKSPTVVAVAIPVVSLGLPVLDTALAIVRRFLRGQPIFAADRGHIHHRLLSLGHSPRKAALLLYAVCALFATGAMLLVWERGYIALVLLVVGLAVGLAVQRLRFYEFEELSRLVRRGVQQRQSIGRGVRIREASYRVSELMDVGLIFQTLESTFAQDHFLRAEVRLRRSFAGDSNDSGTPGLRIDDDLVVWSWSRADTDSPAAWEIRLPLVNTEQKRFGSLLLWLDGHAGDLSLSQVPTIAEELRRALERKLLVLWNGAGRESTGAAAMSRGVGSERRDREEGARAEGSGAVRTRSAPATGPRPSAA